MTSSVFSLPAGPSPDKPAESKSSAAAPKWRWLPPGVARVAGPLVLYVLIALGILSPYRSNSFRGVGDLSVVMAISADARYAFKEHQFPIRTAPHIHDGLRYPIFQYYGNFPYTLTGGLAAALGLGPYRSWKVVMLASLVTAGFVTMLLARRLTRRPVGATLAGAVFMAAPYLWTDINARGAFAETIAFDLLPVAFYFTLRCFRSRHPRYVLATALVWSFTCMTHNITYLYGVMFMALFLLPFAVSARGLPHRIARLIAAGVLHAMLVAWYLAPQFASLPLLAIHEATGDPNGPGALSPLRILVAPVLTNTLDGASTPNLGLQIGWPILAGVLVALLGLPLCWRRVAARVRGTTAVLLILFFVAVFMVWTPFDFWKFLPKVLWFVQFPYRLLIFAVLFGSLLFACAYAIVFPRGRGAPAWVNLGLLALLGFSVASYYPRPAPLEPGFIKWIERKPGIVKVDDYVISRTALARTSVTTLDSDILTWDARMKVTDAMKPGHPSLPTEPLPRSHMRAQTVPKFLYTADRPVLLELPALWYPPGLLEVSDNGKRTPFVNAGPFVAVRLQAGSHELAVRYIGVRWANLLSGIGWGIVIGGFGMIVWRRRRRAGAGATKAAILPARPRPGLRPLGAVVGFGAMWVGAAIPIISPIRLLMDHSPRLTASTSARAPESSPQAAFDGEPGTFWLADNSDPCTLSVKFSHAANLHGLVLEPRLTALYEGFRHVDVILFYHGRRVFTRPFDFPNAAHEPQDIINFPKIRADQIELDFSEPILEQRDGTHVTPGMVRPGYSEIRIQWN